MKSAKRDKMSASERLFNEAERHEEMGDFRGAFTRLLAAANLGHIGSQLNVGNFYASGTGVRKNIERAAHWYKKAYKNGCSTAALNLAIDRRNAGNFRSAVVWLTKAIAMHDGDGCVALARMYNARKRNVAGNLLRRALGMSSDDISDGGKEEARSLLKQIARRRSP